MTLKTNFCPDCGKRNSEIHTCSPAYAVEKAETQEPVAWIFADWSGTSSPELTFDGPPAEPSVRDGLTKPVWTPLYATPPAAQRQPLTDEQIYAIGKELGMKCRLGGNPNIDLDYARAIEAAHGIKEQP